MKLLLICVSMIAQQLTRTGYSDIGIDHQLEFLVLKKCIIFSAETKQNHINATFLLIVLLMEV